MKPAPDASPKHLPLLAVRDVVLLPHMALPLSVGREKSIKALEFAHSRGALVAVTAQKKAAVEDPKDCDLHEMGVLAEIAQFLRMPEGTLKVFLRGLRRIEIVSPRVGEGGFWEADVVYPQEAWPKTPQTDALMRQCVQSFESLARLTRRSPPEAAAAMRQIPDPSRLSDIIAANAVSKAADRQALLETLDPDERLERLTAMLKGEAELFNLDRKIHTRVRSQIQKTQKEYYLTEQMKAIQKELRQKDDFQKELDEFMERIRTARMHPSAEEAALKEVARLGKMMPFSPESTVCRTYLDWMVGLPWSVLTEDDLDLDRAARVLAEDHFGLEKVKERVLEHLAVCRLSRGLRGPILCFAGPPGTGKTSIGRSIARAMGRAFVRVALGGVRDEAEIRGHRRTYIGSLPGRIIQSVRKAKSRNPVFLLDEIDKMGTDWRGDPAAALLEVLDPAQNSSFTDHYLDVEFDLSSVLFICTANNLDSIPVALQDRLEVLRFPGYTQVEKRLIARGFLLSKQVKEHGLQPGQLEVEDSAIDRIIQEYTREAGVRNLDREIARLCRKTARRVVEKAEAGVRLGPGDLHEFLGPPKFPPEERSHNEVGVATGLAWSEMGGSLLAIEAASYPGKGDIVLTGKLGAVMQESARAALSFIRSSAARLRIPARAFKGVDFHIHVPEGAVPKDGPSAGAALATALASLLCGRPVQRGLAMTGEVTLRGRVLPIGGLKEKVLAAHRCGIRTVLFPDQNAKDLEEIPKETLAALDMRPVSHMDQVLRLALASRRSSSRRDAAVPLRPSASGYPSQPQA